MSTNKKIAFVIIIVAVIGAIWYLESLKVHSTLSGQPAQAINISANGNTSTVSSSVASSSSATGRNVILRSAEQVALAQLAAADKATGDQPAVEIVDPTDFINVSSTFTLSSLIGKKPILLDFWTYSCINCVRTIPYLNAWYQKYASSGLEIVGIHTPEFDFEKNLANVQNAVTQYGIKYPVVLDSNQGTWNAYNNLYWPNEYLIDMAGYIVHNQVGEANYPETEVAIQNVLQQRATILGLDPNTIPTGTVDVTTANLNEIQSPETYFGAERNSLLANGVSLTNGNQTLTAPAASTAQPNALYLGGVWDFEDQYATNLAAGATIIYEYDAGKVYMVAAGAASGTVIDVMQDGQPIGAAGGTDVENSKVTISANKLYNIVNNSDGGGEHTLQLIIESPGLQAYTFTFG
jgi:thiol-disulfide isomerase/thioredoxin